MKKILKLIMLITALFLSINETLSYYNSSTKMTSIFITKDYAIDLNSQGGTFNNPNIIVDNNTTTLPQPTKIGYEFQGFSISENGDINYSTYVNDVGVINNKTLYAKWQLLTYNITYNLNGGNVSSAPSNYNVEQSFTLPVPTKIGYTFSGWTGTGLSSPTKNVIISNETGDRNYIANWDKNYYTVNYYVNNNLWTHRSVGYNDNLENLNAQSILDIYHTFHGWTGWVDRMPSNDVNLYANITESYCRLTTGHGPYGNAAALFNIFQSAGWTAHIQEQPSYPGNYLVVTDYTLTRAQAENQKQYIASRTNYNSYNYPYLFWVAVDCTNGYWEAWTRNFGQSNFN